MLHQTKAGKVEVHEIDASELILDNLVRIRRNIKVTKTKGIRGLKEGRVIYKMNFYEWLVSDV